MGGGNLRNLTVIIGEQAVKAQIRVKQSDAGSVDKSGQVENTERERDRDTDTESEREREREREKETERETETERCVSNYARLACLSTEYLRCAFVVCIALSVVSMSAIIST